MAMRTEPATDFHKLALGNAHRLSSIYPLAPPPNRLRSRRMPTPSSRTARHGTNRLWTQLEPPPNNRHPARTLPFLPRHPPRVQHDWSLSRMATCTGNPHQSLSHWCRPRSSRTIVITTTTSPIMPSCRSACRRHWRSPCISFPKA